MDTISLWKKTTNFSHQSALSGDLEVEVAVLGGGIAGILTAYLLGQHNIDAVVLEASHLFSGQTGNTTAKITSQHGLCYNALIQNVGMDKARQYAEANQHAISQYFKIAQEVGADCDLKELPACVYSNVAVEPLRREAAAARSLGLDAAFIEACALPLPHLGAVSFSGQAQFHPLKFLGTLAKHLRVFENTRAIAVEGDRIHTSQGTVRAKHIVFATHYPFINVPGWYFLRMHQERSYVLALENAWTPDAMYYGADADGLSLRAAEGALLLGAGGHRTGENSAGGRYEMLAAQAQSAFPESHAIARWSAQDCITLDGIPYIGRFSPSQPNWYVATGFGKWGMTSSMVAAEIISGMIVGETPKWAEVFSPSRFNLSASAKNLATQTAQSFKGLSRAVFSFPREALDELAPGRGGIVEVQGERLGVYREPDGTVHAIRPRCPHLGCELSWNPDETSWDCPCHGSRFHFDGSLLDNPAQENLERAET